MAGGAERLAAHLIELARDAASAAIQAARAEVYARCVAAETSLIGKALVSVYMREAQGRL